MSDTILKQEACFLENFVFLIREKSIYLPTSEICIEKIKAATKYCDSILLDMECIMSGPKCDEFYLSEEEIQRQQEEQERLLREEEERIRREEERRIREAKERHQRAVTVETNATLELLKQVQPDPQQDKFNEVYYAYQAAATLAGEEAKVYNYEKDTAAVFISEMEAATKRWKEKSLEVKCRQRVDEIICETIEEMGYELIGENVSEKTSGATQPAAHLYAYDEDTAISVISANGQFTMEVVAIDEKDRSVTEKEADTLEKEMHAFCGDYETLLKRLEEKHVIHKSNVFHMPPSKRYARVINTSAYKKSASEKNRRKYTEDYMTPVSTKEKKHGKRK